MIIYGAIVQAKVFFSVYYIPDLEENLSSGIAWCENNAGISKLKLEMPALLSYHAIPNIASLVIDHDLTSKSKLTKPLSQQLAQQLADRIKTRPSHVWKQVDWNSASEAQVRLRLLKMRAK